MPPETPKSYTSLNLISTFGKFDMEHTFDEQLYQGVCGGGPYWSGKDVGYKHTYIVGGVGINRKVYHNERQSTLLSLNILAGREQESPIYNPYQNLIAPTFKNTLWSFNPSVQYDAKHIGLGLGATFGKVAYDKEDPDDHEDYNPEDDGRNFAIQTRLRLFNEKKFFVEVLSGFDASAVGEYNWQALGGSRFNSDKYMFKAGFAFAEHSSSSFILKGEMLLAPNLYISPQFILYRKEDYSSYDQERGYRAVIGLEYRFHDKMK
jgi:hypothetical protein